MKIIEISCCEDCPFYTLSYPWGVGHCGFNEDNIIEMDHDFSCYSDILPNCPLIGGAALFKLKGD